MLAAVPFFSDSTTAAVGVIACEGVSHGAGVGVANGVRVDVAPGVGVDVG